MNRRTHEWFAIWWEIVFFGCWITKKKKDTVISIIMIWWLGVANAVKVVSETGNQASSGLDEMIKGDSFLAPIKSALKTIFFFF